MFEFLSYWRRVAGRAWRDTDWLTARKLAGTLGLIVLREFLGGEAGVRTWQEVTETIVVAGAAYAMLAAADYVLHFLSAPAVLALEARRDNESLRARIGVLSAGRAILEPRYEPDDAPHLGPNAYEVAHHIGAAYYRLGVFNSGPAVARNVVVEVVDAFSRKPSSGSGTTRWMDGFPIVCRRADNTPIEGQINPNYEALYHIGNSVRMGPPGSPLGFLFDWRQGLRSGLRDDTTFTVRFRITAENADTRECGMVFQEGPDERIVGRLEMDPDLRSN